MSGLKMEDREGEKTKLVDKIDIRFQIKPSRTFCSLCPTYILSSSGPLTLKKFILNSDATAFASSVFPVPGGPYSKIPLIFRINT